jgi:arylsulfatase
MNPAIAGRPTLVQGDQLRLYPGMTRLGENVAISIKNRSYSVTAEIEVPDGPPVDGALVAQGGRTGGWALLVSDGKLTYHYNYCGLLRATITAGEPLPQGTHQVRGSSPTPAAASGGAGR